MAAAKLVRLAAEFVLLQMHALSADLIISLLMETVFKSFALMDTWN